MIQSQNFVTRPISRLDSIMSELINKNEESLSCQPLINPYISNSIDWTQESCYFRNQDSISAYTFELDQTPCFESYPFPEIGIEHECDPEPHVDDSISLFDSIITPVSIPDFSSYSRVNIESCTSTL